jgi:DNA-binding CsgD family transcriptional regulator
MTTLTEREKLILDLVQQGMTNSKIAIEADINPTAVVISIRSIKDKLGVNTKQDIIELAKKEQQAQ